MQTWSLRSREAATERGMAVRGGEHGYSGAREEALSTTSSGPHEKLILDVSREDTSHSSCSEANSKTQSTVLFPPVHGHPSRLSPPSATCGASFHSPLCRRRLQKPLVRRVTKKHTKCLSDVSSVMLPLKRQGPQTWRPGACCFKGTASAFLSPLPGLRGPAKRKGRGADSH